jgi:hypothetical protein
MCGTHPATSSAMDIRLMPRHARSRLVHDAYDAAVLLDEDVAL